MCFWREHCGGINWEGKGSSRVVEYHEVGRRVRVLRCIPRAVKTLEAYLLVEVASSSAEATSRGLLEGCWCWLYEHFQLCKLGVSSIKRKHGQSQGGHLVTSGGPLWLWGKFYISDVTTMSTWCHLMGTMHYFGVGLMSLSFVGTCKSPQENTLASFKCNCVSDLILPDNLWLSSNIQWISFKHSNILLLRFYKPLTAASVKSWEIIGQPWRKFILVSPFQMERDVKLDSTLPPLTEAELLANTFKKVKVYIFLLWDPQYYPIKWKKLLPFHYTALLIRIKYVMAK